MPVITFLNQKGGVGKTSCCFHLGGALAKSGRSVLLVDNDPQASLTQGIYGPEASERIPRSETIAAVYEGERPLPCQVIRETAWPGISILSGSHHLTRWNRPEPRSETWEAQNRLADFVADIKRTYAMILIDCAPNLHLCSWAALLASDSVVIPLQAEDYGAQGMLAVLNSIDAAKAVNPGLDLAGYLITMFDKRTALSRMYEDLLRTQYQDKVFENSIPRLVDFAEAVNQRKPVSRYRPKGQASLSVDATAAELALRVNRLFKAKTPAAMARKARHV